MVQRPADEVEVKAPIRNLRDYFAEPPPDLPRIVEPAVVLRGGLTVTYGRAGFGKTSVNLHRIVRWAAGLPMFDQEPDLYVPFGPVKTLVIENEGAAAEFHDTLKLMLETGGFTPAQRELILDNLLIWGDGGYSDLRVDDGQAISLVRRGIETHEPDIVFMEPFSHLHSKNENDNSELRDVTAILQRLAAEYGIGIMLGHHERKGGAQDDDIMSAQRGGTVFEGAAAYMERFQKAKGADLRELVEAKRRYRRPKDSRAPDPKHGIRMQWREDDSGWYDYVSPETTNAEILEHLDGARPRNVPELLDMLEESDTEANRRRLRSHLNKLVDQGLARKRAGSEFGMQGNVYFLSSAGDAPPRHEAPGLTF